MTRRLFRFRVWGLGFGFGVQGLGFTVQGVTITWVHKVSGVSDHNMGA